MLAIGSDNLVSLTNLYDSIATAYVDNATVAGQIEDMGGNVLYSFSLSYISSSTGDYQGVVPASVTAGLTVDTVYVIQVTATTTGGNILITRHRDVADYPTN